jgi:hypothetical protein
MIAKKEMAKEA